MNTGNCILNNRLDMFLSGLLDLYSRDHDTSFPELFRKISGNYGTEGVSLLTLHMCEQLFERFALYLTDQHMDPESSVVQDVLSINYEDIPYFAKIAHWDFGYQVRLIFALGFKSQEQLKTTARGW